MTRRVFLAGLPTDVWSRAVSNRSVVVLVFVLSTVIGLFASERLSNPSIRAEIESLDFGTVWAQDGFPWRIQLTNTGWKTVRVQRFQAACGCVTELTPSSMLIRPGETSEVSVLLDLTEAAEDAQTSPFSVRVSATCNAPSHCTSEHP
jgi:hypothetical protein